MYALQLPAARAGLVACVRAYHLQYRSIRGGTDRLTAQSIDQSLSCCKSSYWVFFAGSIATAGRLLAVTYRAKASRPRRYAACSMLFLCSSNIPPPGRGGGGGVVVPQLLYLCCRSLFASYCAAANSMRKISHCLFSLVFIFSHIACLSPVAHRCCWKMVVRCSPRTVFIVPHPRSFEAKNFLLEDECQHIKAKADPHMKPSPVSLMDHDKGKPDTDWRTRCPLDPFVRTRPFVSCDRSLVWSFVYLVVRSFILLFVRLVVRLIVRAVW